MGKGVQDDDGTGVERGAFGGEVIYAEREELLIYLLYVFLKEVHIVSLIAPTCGTVLTR